MSYDYLVVGAGLYGAVFAQVAKAKGKKVLVRCDFNVPMDENFKVTNTARIDRTVPTIKTLMEKGAKVVVISHFGRPEGKGGKDGQLRPRPGSRGGVPQDQRIHPVQGASGSRTYGKRQYYAEGIP